MAWILTDSRIHFSWFLFNSDLFVCFQFLYKIWLHMKDFLSCCTGEFSDWLHWFLRMDINKELLIQFRFTVILFYFKFGLISILECYNVQFALYINCFSLLKLYRNCFSDWLYQCLQLVITYSLIPFRFTAILFYKKKNKITYKIWITRVICFMNQATPFALHVFDSLTRTGPLEEFLLNQK